MTRKRGKQRKPAADAVPEDVLAEGSGPVRRVDKDAITTVEDVVTTDDIATTDDVVTADDIVVTADSGDEAEADADAETEPAEVEPADTGRRGARAATTGRAGAAANGKARGRAKGKKPSSAARKARADAGSSADAADAAAIHAGDTVVANADAGAHADDDAEADAADLREAGGLAVDGAEAFEANEADQVEADDAADNGVEAGTAWGSELVDGETEGSISSSMTASIELSASHDDDAGADGDGNGYASANGEPGDGDGDGDDDGDVDGNGDGDGDGDGDASADGEPRDDDDAAVVFPTSAASMDALQLKHLVEALIFASDRPLTVQRLRQLTRVGEVRRLQQALAELSEDYRERGLILQQVSGGYQFRTRTQFSAWVQQLIAGRPVRLSRAQLETLAIIAYRQPITRPEIDDIRGVDSTATLKLLIDRMLIRVLGKREEVGRPMLYGTTKEFLDFFSLGDLRELPTLREYSELTAESRKVMSDRLGIAPDGDGGEGSGGGGPGGDGSGNGGGSDGGGFNGGGFNGGGFNGGGFNGGGFNGGGFNGGGFNGGGSNGGGLDGGAFEGSAGGPPPGTHDGGAFEGSAGGPPPGTHDGGISDSGVPVDASAPDVPADVSADVSEALSAFWAAADAVDRSAVADVDETDDDAPADTWFDPAIGNSLDGPDAPDLDEPLAASRERAGALGSQRVERLDAVDVVEALDERAGTPGPARAEPVAE